MRREEVSERDAPIGLLDWRRILPYAPAVASDRLGWVGLEAMRFRASPAAELHQPALTHHMLVLFARPPDALDLWYDGVQRHVPPPPGRFRWCRPAARSGCAWRCETPALGSTCSRWPDSSTPSSRPSREAWAWG